MFSEEAKIPDLNPYQRRLMNQLIDMQMKSSKVIIFMPRKMGYNTFKKHFDMELGKKKYIVIGGYVRSKSDGDEHYVSAGKLCRLYNLNPEECYCVEEKEYERKKRGMPTLPVLRPRFDGNYHLLDK